MGYNRLCCAIKWVRWALHKKYIVGAYRAPLQLRTQAVGAVYDRPGFFVQSRCDA